MPKKVEIGMCRICGQSGELSFEHIPPQSAYNKATVIAYEWDVRTQSRKSKGKSLQGGIGAYTLCHRCNNNTGSWYGGEYVKWARTCHDVMVLWQVRKITFGYITLNGVYPSRFLKQAVTCFFSEVGKEYAEFGKNNPDLADFVLNRDSKALPDGFRFFLALYRNSDKTNLRRWVNMGRIRGGRGNVFDEIAHPPFQLIMTEDDEEFDGATEITRFSKYGYDENINLSIPLRIVDSSSPYPGAG